MKILILQAGFNELGVIAQLKKEGHYVIAIGKQKGLIGQKYVDEYHCLDYSAKEEVLKFIKEHNVDRVCACCNDTAVLTASYVAEKMCLSGYDTYKSAETIAHKNLFKRFAKENGIMTVEAVEFSEEKRAVQYMEEEAEYPMIIKPIDLSGGKGVAKVTNISESRAALKAAFDISKKKTIVIEPFINGTQHGFCTFLKEKKVVAYCSNNEYSFVNPYRVEVDTFPADNIDRYKDILIQQVEKMADILDLQDGIFHMQYMEQNGKIYILEAMRRIIGNMYSMPASKVCDFEWDRWQAKASIGESCEMAPLKCESKGYYAYRAIIPPKNGILERVVIDERIEQYIFDRIMLEESGAVISNYKASTVGILFLQFQSKEEMKKVMIEDYHKIYAVIKD